MRSRHAYIRQAAHRPAPPRRVVPPNPLPPPPPVWLDPAAGLKATPLRGGLRPALTPTARSNTPKPGGPHAKQRTPHHSTPFHLTVPFHIRSLRAESYD